MSIIILGKLLAGGVAVVGGSFVLWLGVEKLMHKTIDAYVKTSSNSGGASSKIDEGIKNYECQFSSTTARKVVDVNTTSIESATFDCDVVQIEIDSTNKYLNWSDSTTTKKAEQSELSTENNVFKISISSKHFYTDLDMSRKIEVISKTEKENDTAKVYASTETLFSVDGNKKIGKTKYFVGTAKTASATSDTISAYKCSWDNKSNNSSAHTCKVYDFAESGKDSVFKKVDSDATSVSADKHYLIEWTENNHTDHQVQQENSEQQLSIFYKPTTGRSDVAIEFAEIKSAFLISDKLLIL